MKLLLLLTTATILLVATQISTYKVISVHDGDTFEIIKNGKKQSCRIANIDAPELKQRFGIEARDSLIKFILNKDVLIDSLTTDRYNRMIVDVFVDGEYINQKMIDNGIAWHYKTYSYDQSLENNMQNAIIAKIGLWHCGKEKVCPPWLYRKYNKYNKAKYCQGCVTLNL